jgi:16S rRNA processing protein RimM
MSENFVKVGRLGRVHGLKGELKFSIEEAYLEDTINAKSLLIHLGGQYIPYFVEYLRKSSLLKLEEVGDKEMAQLLQHKDVFLPASAISEAVEEVPDNPYSHWVGYKIVDEEKGELGEIQAIIDLPQHYLAEIAYEGKTVAIPLHDDLILGLDPEGKAVLMQLPEGLLDL